MMQRTPSTSVTVVALVTYLAVMVSLTMLKAFYQIGLLWEPSNQRVRELDLVPLDYLWDAAVHGGSWFAPIFDYVGNVAFFVPYGMLLVVLLLRWGLKPVTVIARVAVIGAGTSVLMEAAQYIFSLGRTDIDDVVFNTLGAVMGALVALWCGRRWHWVWVYLALALGVVFAILVGLGDRLGDPAKVKDV